MTQQLGLFGSMREEAALRHLVSGRTSIVHVVHQSGDGVSHFIHTGVTKTDAMSVASVILMQNC